MYALLGDRIEFDLITYFDGLETTFAAEYAEHALIGKKPRLQFVGDALDLIQIDLVFHASYCDPEAELLRLRKAVTSHEAFSFVLGNGDYKGRFVVATLSATGQHTDKAGTLLAVTARMGLKEFTGDPTRPQAPAVRSALSKTTITATTVVKDLPEQYKPPVSQVSQAVTAAKAAFSTFSKGLSVLSAVRAVASRDPLTALMRLPKALSAISSAGPALGLAEEHLDSLKGFSAVAGDAAAVSRSVSWARGEATALVGQLGGANAGSIGRILSAADSSSSRASSEIESVTLPLARMAARASTRTV